MNLLRRLVFATVVVFATTGGAHAQRVIPETAFVGDLEGIVVPEIRISGKRFRLAPGSKFRDRDNRIVVPVSAPQSGRIAFNFDLMGQVWGIWLLTPTEIELMKARGRDIKDVIR
ncbi:MAG: hypothetical protein MUF30_06620 [Burkholderiales bacterium]|nr:hypothetical protein [Burkholderiales bacterium]